MRMSRNSGLLVQARTKAQAGVGNYESVTHSCHFDDCGRVTGKPEVTCFEWEPGFVRTQWGWFT